MSLGTDLRTTDFSNAKRENPRKALVLPSAYYNFRAVDRASRYRGAIEAGITGRARELKEPLA